MEENTDAKRIWWIADYLLKSRRTDTLRYYFVEGPIIDIDRLGHGIAVSYGEKGGANILFYGTKSQVGNYNPNEDILERLEDIYKTKFSKPCELCLTEK